MIRVTLLTASMPRRAGMLAELLESVRAQTWQPERHLIEIDWRVDGFVTVANRLAAQVDTEWLMILPDDDLIDVTHLQVLVGAIEPHDDVIYSWCRSTGRDGWTPNSEFDPGSLRAANYIPGGACLIRTELWDRLGGYRRPDANADHAEDWDFWLRALDTNARFRCVPQVTWTYRFHGQNLSLGQLPYSCK